MADSLPERRTLKETADQLHAWAKAKRRCGLTDAQIQMARELGMNPQRLTESQGSAQGATQMPLTQSIEAHYLRRFKRPQPDSVMPVRQLLHDARAREKDEARERRRRKRQAEIDHLEAARFTLLTLRRLLPGVPIDDISVDGPERAESRPRSRRG
jgi:hypothetical protein